MSLRGFGAGFGRRTLLRGVDADFPAGTLTALLGRNGAGKSTMLRAMAGLGDYSGTVEIDGRDARRMTPRERARAVAYVGAGRIRVAAMSCRAVVEMGRAPYTGWTGRLSEPDRAIVDRAFEAVGIAALAERTADTLSDGEFQRVMIARALAQDTPAIILDEPTSFLDIPNRLQLCKLLRDLAHTTGKSVLFSTHELDLALRLADRIALIDTPRLIVDGSEATAASGEIERVFSLPEGSLGSGDKS